MEVSESDILKQLDHQRWLLNNGFLNDLIKDNLFLYGYLVSPSVRQVELAVEPAARTITYKLYFDRKFLGQIEKFQRLRGSTRLWDLWRLRRMLRKNGNMDFTGMISRMIKDYCGPSWKPSVELKDVREYKKDFNVPAGPVSDDTRSG